MDVNALSALGSGAAGKSQVGLAENFDTFLKLLTTQLQNQDPLEPLDTNQFTEQLVQFSEVEQSISMNKNLELLVGLTQAASSGHAVSYLGKVVVADGAQAQLTAGKATWHYNVANNADEVKLTILDSAKNPIFTTQGETGSGDHVFSWDGKNANGVLQKDGSYTIQVKAKDASGNAIITETSIRGRVGAVDFDGSEPSLLVNGASVPINSVREVIDPKA